MYERETFCEIVRSGKSVSVSCYEKRYDYAGTPYYARFDGIQSRQRKRVMDWASDKPVNIRATIANFYNGRDEK